MKALGEERPWAPLGSHSLQPKSRAGVFSRRPSAGVAVVPGGPGVGVAGLASALFSPAEPLREDGTAGRLAEPEDGADGLPCSEPGPCLFQPLDTPPAVPLPRRPPALAEPPSCPPAAAAPELSASPRLAVDLALPGALPAELALTSSHTALDGEPEEAVPAQVALSVTDFGLLGIGDVNPFLAAHPACPAPGLHSEPLSQ